MITARASTNTSPRRRLLPRACRVFSSSLGIPLITHARWIDASSPYRNALQDVGQCGDWTRPTGITWPDIWPTSGVATYEQDWLDDKAQPDFNLTDAEAFLDNMAAAMAAAQSHACNTAWPRRGTLCKAPSTAT